MVLIKVVPNWNFSDMVLIKVVPSGKDKTLNITSKKMIFGNMHIFSKEGTILKKKMNFTNYAHNYL